jgi:hypothetical protein
MARTNTESFAVTDLYEAAALVAAGFQIKSFTTESKRGKPPRFTFAVDDRIAETLQQHRDQELLVNSSLYAEAIRKLRSWSNMNLSSKQPTAYGGVDSW